jgi:hypothetical protein
MFEALRNVIMLIKTQNLLRKSLAWNFNYYQEEGLGPFSNDAGIIKHHVSKYKSAHNAWPCN